MVRLLNSWPSSHSVHCRSQLPHMQKQPSFQSQMESSLSSGCVTLGKSAISLCNGDKATPASLPESLLVGSRYTYFATKAMALKYHFSPTDGYIRTAVPIIS